MKTRILSLILLASAITACAATKNIVPNADGQGALGTTNKRWGYVNAVTGAFSGAITLNGVPVLTNAPAGGSTNQTTSATNDTFAGNVTAQSFIGSGALLTGLPGGGDVTQAILDATNSLIRAQIKTADGNATNAFSLLTLTPDNGTGLFSLDFGDVGFDGSAIRFDQNAPGLLLTNVLTGRAVTLDLSPSGIVRMDEMTSHVAGAVSPFADYASTNHPALYWPDTASGGTAHWLATLSPEGGPQWTHYDSEGLPVTNLVLLSDGNIRAGGAIAAAAFVGSGALLTDLPGGGDVTSSQLYAQGISITNDVNTRTANLTNALNAFSLACSNLSYAIGTASTNRENLFSVALSNLCYTIGANSTNYASTKQTGTWQLTNLLAGGWSNILAASGIALGTNGGVLWITNTGTAAASSNYVALAVGTLTVTNDITAATLTMTTLNVGTLGFTNAPTLSNHVLTVNGSSNVTAGPLLSQIVTNAQLTTATNRIETKQAGSAILTNLAGTGVITNAPWTNSYQIASAILTNISGTGAITNLTRIAKFATNAAWNINLPIEGSVNAITNTLGGSTANIWLTNVVDGGYFVARILADGTARTVSVTNASGLTINVINTNGFSGVGTIPTVAITASKRCIIAGRAWVVAGVTNVDVWANVQQ